MCVCVCNPLLKDVSFVLQYSVVFHAPSYNVTHVKSLWFAQDLTDTAICLSSLAMNECTSRFSKVLGSLLFTSYH